MRSRVPTSLSSSILEWQATDLLWMMTQMGFGTLLGYTIAGGLLKKETPIPAGTDV